MTTSCTFTDPATGQREDIQYLEVGDATAGHVYLVHHHARGQSRGGVVLCGSISSDREGCLRTMVDMARALAASGFDVVRFDYRGIGESTGRFEDYSFSDWRRDIEVCIGLLRERLSGRPIALWGVRAGALLVSEAFRDELGDAAMFCAPTDAQPFLQGILRRSLVNDMLSRPGLKRANRAEIIAAIEQGAAVNIDGYLWSARLWMDAASHRFVVPAGDSRPWQVVDFTDHPRTDLGGGENESHRKLSSVGRFWEAAPTRVAKDGSLLQITMDWLNSLTSSPTTRAVTSS